MAAAGGGGAGPGGKIRTRMYHLSLGRTPYSKSLTPGPQQQAPVIRRVKPKPCNPTYGVISSDARRILKSLKMSSPLADARRIPSVSSPSATTPENIVIDVADYLSKRKRDARRIPSVSSPSATDARRIPSVSSPSATAPVIREVKASEPANNLSYDGLSKTARRILKSLEKMSSPLADARRIPSVSSPSATTPENIVIDVADYLSKRKRVEASYPAMKTLVTRKSISTKSSVYIKPSLATSSIGNASSRQTRVTSTK